jgi:hypothetical protein
MTDPVLTLSIIDSSKVKWSMNECVRMSEVSSEATQGKASAVADKRIAKPLSQGLLTQGLVVR